MQYAPGCIIQCAMVGSKWRCSYLFSIKTAIVDNSIHLPTMDEEEHGFNQPCMFPTLVFISASWNPEPWILTSLREYFHFTTFLESLHSTFHRLRTPLPPILWLAYPHNGAEVYLCNPCSSKKETRVRGCSSTLRLRSCVCLPHPSSFDCPFIFLLCYLATCLVHWSFNDLIWSRLIPLIVPNTCM